MTPSTASFARWRSHDIGRADVGEQAQRATLGWAEDGHRLVELAPVTAQEPAEALNFVGLYVRRSRLVELEAMALAHATRTRMLPAAGPGGPPISGEPVRSVSLAAQAQ